MFKLKNLKNKIVAVGLVSAAVLALNTASFCAANEKQLNEINVVSDMIVNDVLKPSTFSNKEAVNDLINKVVDLKARLNKDIKSVSNEEIDELTVKFSDVAKNEEDLFKSAEEKEQEKNKEFNFLSCTEKQSANYMLSRLFDYFYYKQYFKNNIGEQFNASEYINKFKLNFSRINEFANLVFSNKIDCLEGFLNESQSEIDKFSKEVGQGAEEMQKSQNKVIADIKSKGLKQTLEDLGIREEDFVKRTQIHFTWRTFMHLAADIRTQIIEAVQA